MVRTISIKFRNQEVRNPVLRILLGVVLAVVWAVGMLLVALVVLAMIALAPVWLVVHLILVACGRQGFILRSPGKVNITIGPGGFRKA